MSGFLPITKYAPVFLLYMCNGFQPQLNFIASSKYIIILGSDMFRPQPEHLSYNLYGRHAKFPKTAKFQSTVTFGIY